MGYDIYIGNAVCESERDGDELWSRWTVQGTTSDKAPVFEYDAMTGNGNSRHPSYSGWADFAEETGLTDFFFDKQEGMLREHPGCFIITEDHYNTVKKALMLRRGKGGKAGFGDGEDYNLARLMWMEFWMRWALDNCENPAIANS
jgi:hypothetical protein